MLRKYIFNTNREKSLRLSVHIIFFYFLIRPPVPQWLMCLKTKALTSDNRNSCGGGGGGGVVSFLFFPECLMSPSATETSCEQVSRLTFIFFLHHST